MRSSMTSHHSFRLLAVAALATFAAACNDDSFSPQVIEETQFASSLDIDLANFTRTASGLYIEDVTVGSGDALVVGDTARVAYSGWLSDGILFDSGSFEFVVGVDPVIDGFEEGVLGMQLGGVRRLIIPSALAYGDQGSGPIPGGAILVFRVEVLSVG